MSRDKSTGRCRAGGGSPPICSMSSLWPRSSSDPAAKQSKSKKRPSATDPGLAAHILQKRIARLGKQIRHAAGPQGRSQWSRYEQCASHYPPADVEAKQQFVKTRAGALPPGARPRYRRQHGNLFAVWRPNAGAEVVALDSDSAALEALWRTAARAEQIHHRVGREHRPSHARGGMEKSRASLAARPPQPANLTWYSCSP